MELRTGENSSNQEKTKTTKQDEQSTYLEMKRLRKVLQWLVGKVGDLITVEN